MEVSRQRRIASRVFVGLSVLFIFLAGWLFGSYYQQSKDGLDLTKFWHVYSLIKDRYPGSFDADKAVDGAIGGLVSSLEDPYSSFLTEEDKKRLEEDLSGEFEGIGAILTQKDSQIVVVGILDGSPASTAKLQADDVILAVNQELTDGQVLDQVVSRIRGPKGSEVTLTIRRSEKVSEITIKRDRIEVKSVTYSKSGEVGVIKIAQFGDDTIVGLKEAITDLEKQGSKKYLIDLRDNPGGYLGVVTEAAGFFLPPGSVVVKEKFRGSRGDEIKTKGTPLIPTKPIFVLINGGSASASEILAGALQDHQRAEVLGEKSYGKGSVQDVLNLRGNTALRLTIAEWLTPKDRAINKVGIEPDRKIASDSDEKELESALNYINSR